MSNVENWSNESVFRFFAQCAYWFLLKPTPNVHIEQFGSVQTRPSTFEQWHNRAPLHLYRHMLGLCEFEMYTEVTRSLAELSQDRDEGSEEKPNSGHPPHTRLYGVHSCVRAFVCVCILWVFVYPFSSRTPRSKPQPTLPPHASLFLSFSNSPPPLSLKTAGPGF